MGAVLDVCVLDQSEFMAEGQVCLTPRIPPHTAKRELSGMVSAQCLAQASYHVWCCSSLRGWLTFEVASIFVEIFSRNLTFREGFLASSRGQME